MLVTRPQWPHTIDDIIKALDGVWGLVGATGVNGHLYRLERSLHQPLVYTLTEYVDNDDRQVLEQKAFPADDKSSAVRQFAQVLGFQVDS